MGESPRVERPNGGSASATNPRPREQLGLPMEPGFKAGEPDPSDRLMRILEERVVGLMERFDESRKRVQALENELAERDAQLEAVLGEQDALRQQVRERLARIIERISELEKLESSKDSPA